MNLLVTAQVQAQSVQQTFQRHLHQQVTSTFIQQPAPDLSTLSPPSAVASSMSGSLADEIDNPYFSECRKQVNASPPWHQSAAGDRNEKSCTQRTAQALGVSDSYAEQVEGSSCSARSNGGEALQMTCSVEALQKKLSAYGPDEFTSAPPPGFRLDFDLAEILPTMICAAVNDAHEDLTITPTQSGRPQEQKLLRTPAAGDVPH